MTRFCMRPLDVLSAFVSCTVAAIGVVLLMASPAAAAVGQAGPVALLVAPTNGLTDSQTIGIHAQAAPGSDLFEIKAHLCQGDVTIDNTWDFGFDSAYCSKLPVSPNADAETSVELPRNAGGKGDLNFRVGTGQAPTWWDVDGAPHTYACGNGPCQLVVQVQVPNNTYFYSAPLCFGASCPSEPVLVFPPADPTPPGKAQGSGGGAASDKSPNPTTKGQNQAGARGSAAGGGKSGTAEPAKTTPTSTPTTSPPGGAAGSSGAAPGSGQDAQQAAAGTQASAASNASHELSRTARVFLGGAAGVLGGALIAWIVVRARRRMQSGAAS